MSRNPQASVTILSTLDANEANGNNIVYKVNNQVEVINTAKAYIYYNNQQICTYYNNSAPLETADGFLFPIEITSSSTNVSWASGHSINDWQNQRQYSISIITVGNSGDSPVSLAQPFYCVKTPTASFTTISSTVSNTVMTGEVEVDIGQGTMSNLVTRYQFALFDVYTNNIVASSGWIYGSGTVSGTNKYRFTYTFNGLEDGKTYRMRFFATTTLNSETSAISGIFTVDTGVSLEGVLIAENNCQGGYIHVSGVGLISRSDINYIRLERSINADSPNPTWVGLDEKSVLGANEMIDATYDDYFVPNGANATYRAVPIYRQGSFEQIGKPLVLNESVQSQFNSVYLVDGTMRYALSARVAYEPLTTNQQTGVHTPLGSQYPIVVRNADTQYQTGGFSGVVLPPNYDGSVELGTLDSRQSMSKQRMILEEFLSNGAPKVLKDWNGNIWLVQITDNVNVSFENNIGMAIATISGSWTQLGDVYNTVDLRQAGLINVGGR